LVLLDGGADVNAKDEVNDVLPYSDFLHLVFYLAKHIASTIRLTTLAMVIYTLSRYQDALTPLHGITNKKIVSLLLRRGADIAARDKVLRDTVMGTIRRCHCNGYYPPLSL
jgi:hypothetical protein